LQYGEVFLDGPVDALLVQREELQLFRFQREDASAKRVRQAGDQRWDRCWGVAGIGDAGISIYFRGL
jgi:hypothetical protein